uniref:FERM domain-containing protein n=1 Tax=Stomoxys calcitrans TaxID=35570 RepID=A0A1I8Q1U9_STOCA
MITKAIKYEKFLTSFTRINKNKQVLHKGSYLLDNICDQLKIIDKDYFGLRYVDSSNQRQWLDAGKSIIKQCRDADPILFSFRVKFYPADPFRLSSNARIMLYQQLKRDLRHGRIYCSIGEAAALGSLIVQEQLGDYNEEIHTDNYVSSLHLALRQTEVLEHKIIELHKKREPFQDTRETMNEFVRIVSGLETYGIDPHPVKDHRGSQLYIGMNYSGISTFICGKRSQHFRWSEVQKLNFEGKMFIAHLSYTDASKEPKKHTVGFKCGSNTTCRYLWRCAVEQMLFFTLANSQSAAIISGGGFFSWGTKFKYTGRTEREILAESINALREQKMNNSAISKRKASSVPATPSSPSGDIEHIRYSSLPRSTISEPLTYCIAAAECLNNQTQMYDDSDNPTIQISNLEPVSEELKFNHATALKEGSNYVNIVPNNVNYLLQSENKVIYSAPTPGTAETLKIERSENVTSQILKSRSHPFMHKHSPTRSIYWSSKDNFPEKLYRNSSSESAKLARKFKFIHAFIPSLLIVVIVMVGLAILVIESESSIFTQIRELPEMICLRYQYYQPLKKFIFKKMGIDA